MSGDKKLQPIIIKRVKKGGHGHHGGAWKIAYADFVTAMMAFFLLMWLLGSTAKGDLNGIAAYFQSPLKVSLAGGSGSGDSSSILQGGGQDLTRSAGNVKRGEAPEDRNSYNLRVLKAERQRMETERLTGLKDRIESDLANNPKLVEFKSQIRLDMTPDGLRIQIVDEQNRPMFDVGSAVVKDYMRDILRQIGRVLNEGEHRVQLAGHTDATPFGGSERGYSNWELSADRANASRRELVAGGLDEQRVVRVLGLASSVPYDEANPKAPLNRRISIVVLNREATRRVTTGIESDPNREDAVAPERTPLEKATGAAAPGSAAPRRTAP